MPVFWSLQVKGLDTQVITYVCNKFLFEFKIGSRDHNKMQRIKYKANQLGVAIAIIHQPALGTITSNIYACSQIHVQIQHSLADCIAQNSGGRKLWQHEHPLAIFFIQPIPRLVKC